MQGEHVAFLSEARENRLPGHPNVRLWITLLGDFEAQTRQGVSALPISKKARALLCLVAAHMPQALRRDFAASLLWSNKPRDHAANSLRQALRELQIALSACGDPPVLLTGSGRLTLQRDCVWIDIHEPASLKGKLDDVDTVGPLLLCQNLHGLDRAFESHLERLWKNLVFQKAFVPPTDGADGTYGPGRQSVADSELNDFGAESSMLPGSGPAESGMIRAMPGTVGRHEDGVHGQGWRIAVLPFRSLGSPLEGGLSLGMAEEISAALARFRMPRLIATGSFWDGSGPSTDALAKCRAYNLDYVISGTIQTSGARVRVTVSLLDVSMDFEVIWASRFEGTTADLFTLQDTIASQTVAQIDPELLQRHQFRGDSIQAPNAAAHQTLLTAIQGIYRPDRDRFMPARQMLLDAIALDGEYAAAYAWLAYWYTVGLSHGWIDDPLDASISAGQAAERAVSLDPLDARGLTIAGHVKAYLLHDLDTSTMLHDRATSLNPNLPIAWTLSAWARIYKGEHQLALDHAMVAESLSPTDPHAFIMEHAAMTARFFLKDLETADKFATAALERRPRHATALKVRAAILGHMGRQEEAGMCLAALKSLGVTISIESIIARPPLREVDREYYADGLKKAGVVAET
jgi:TolB-like protein